MKHLCVCSLHSGCHDLAYITLGIIFPFSKGDNKAWTVVLMLHTGHQVTLETRHLPPVYPEYLTARLIKPHVYVQQKPKPLLSKDKDSGVRLPGLGHHFCHFLAFVTSVQDEGKFYLICCGGD